jgi:aspartyl/asparaginyl beta-hydroxylase (cupin superfamily)
VNGVEAYHRLGEIVVFDDSLPHKAYNNSEQDRVVLIVDLERPEHLPLGSAKGTSSPELINLINAFK